MSAVKFIDGEKLKTITEYNKLISSELATILHLDDIDDDETVKGEDITIITFSICGKDCKIYHAWPGDQPCGFFVSKEEQFAFGYDAYKSTTDPKTQTGKLFLDWYHSKNGCYGEKKLQGFGL